jgi:hypothetical protein
MASTTAFGSLRTEYVRRRCRSFSPRRLPRPGEERGLTADIAPPSGKALARRPARLRGLPRMPAPRRGSPGLRTLLTMSVIFAWFGL